MKTKIDMIILIFMWLYAAYGGYFVKFDFPFTCMAITMVAVSGFIFGFLVAICKVYLGG